MPASVESTQFGESWGVGEDYLAVFGGDIEIGGVDGLLGVHVRGSRGSGAVAGADGAAEGMVGEGGVNPHDGLRRDGGSCTT